MNGYNVFKYCTRLRMSWSGR